MDENIQKLTVSAQTALVRVDDAIEQATAGENLALPDTFDADLDAGDLAIAFFTGLASIVITTSERAEKWLASVHDAASGKSGEYDFVQSALGGLFRHRGDWIDRVPYGEGFIARNGETAWLMFHRLLFGHDILATGMLENGLPNNPIKLMYEQKGVRGIAQAVRHLLGDTMSKQGLPLPGSSFFDTDRDGRPWNQIIDWVQELSTEAFGNKQEAQTIYSRMFTIRAQDVAGAGLTGAMLKAYERARGIVDPVRVAQLELLGVSIAFFGQALVGSVKQKGVPYINNAMIAPLVTAYIALLCASGKRTLMLKRETNKLAEGTDEIIAQHERIKGVLGVAFPIDEDPRTVASNIEDMIMFLEEGEGDGR